MIGVDQLKESVYKDSYFTEKAGCLTVNNVEESTENTLMSVEMQSKGRFINLSNKILKEGCNIYKAEDRQSGRISYRRDCDGICLLEVDGRNILLVVEVKSGFNEIKKKGFEQLVASYVKVRGILQSIDGYNPADYEEMGLLVSYPPDGSYTMPARSIIGSKLKMIAPTALDTLNNSNSATLKTNHEVVLNLSGYNVDACHVNPSLINPTLRVKHAVVADKSNTGVIDLDSLL